MFAALSPPQSASPVLLPFRRPPTTTSEQHTTVLVAWQTLLKPSLLRQRRRRDWIRELETHVLRWEVFRKEAGTRTIDAVKPRDLEEFQQWVLATVTTRRGAPVTNRTVNKHVDTIEATLRACVAEGLLSAAPRIAALPAPKAARKLHLSLDEADALKRACRVATWPRSGAIPPPLLWETAIVGWCLLGCRTQEWMAYEAEADPICWPAVTWEPLTPHPDGKAEWKCGWIRYVPLKQRRLKSDPLVLPLPESLHAHLVALKKHSGGEGPLLPVPRCNREFYAQWRRIVAEAGIRPRAGLNGHQPDYQIKHLRKTATRWLNDHGSTVGCPGIGDYVTGHAADRAPDREMQSQVTRDHYDFAEDRVLRVLTTLPLPDSFREPLHAGRRQLRLF